MGDDLDEQAVDERAMLEASADPPPVVRLDEFLHTPARLAILSLLSPAENVGFAFLRESLGTTDSALSKHLTQLARAGVVRVVKNEKDRRGRVVELTDEGRVAFEAYLADLEKIVARARGRT